MLHAGYGRCGHRAAKTHVAAWERVGGQGFSIVGSWWGNRHGHSVLHGGDTWLWGESISRGGPWGAPWGGGLWGLLEGMGASMGVGSGKGNLLTGAYGMLCRGVESHGVFFVGLGVWHRGSLGRIQGWGSPLW